MAVLPYGKQLKIAPALLCQNKKIYVVYAFNWLVTLSWLISTPDSLGLQKGGRGRNARDGLRAHTKGNISEVNLHKYILLKQLTEMFWYECFRNH